MASVWVFGCRKRLAQDRCGDEREVDESSRGYSARWGGCPSCKHREAHGPETIRAENYHASTS